MNRPQNDLFLRALKQEKTAQTPIWLMRQAGRYLPEYRALRAKTGGFLAMCQNPEIAAEITLQPILRFPLDAAIIFSDILTIPDAMGLGLHFVENEGPQFLHPLQSAEAIYQLPIIQPEHSLRYVTDAITHARRALNNKIPLIGFSGSPWTLACYMTEGKGSRDFAKAKQMRFSEPQLLHHLLDVLAQSVTHYLNAQIEAGAQAVMIFDSWGGLLSTPDYLEFSLAYVKKIVAGLHKSYDGQQIPSILFTKGGGLWLEAMADCGVSALGLDWTIDLDKARARVGNKVALQGNLDPTVLLGTPAQIVTETSHILQKHVDKAGHIFNLGHGVLQQTDPDAVALLVQEVHAF